MDPSFFSKSIDARNGDDIVESIVINNETELMLAKQHSLMWSEDKYLAIAPGMKQQPLNLIFDEFAEELSFPGIYLGEPRIFIINNVTPYMMATSELRRQDRRGVKPEHVLYMAMKIMRIRLVKSMHMSF